MREFKWSWEQLEETPVYVKMYCWDFLQRIFEKEQDDHNKMIDQQKRGRR